MQRFITRIIFLFFLLYICVTSVTGATTNNSENEIRALWVTRWDYESPFDIHEIVKNAADHHFNVLLFQVRGNGTVFYPSQIEPWAREFGGSDPGWNPLQEAIDQAHHAGIQLHAWVNAFPGWRGNTPPQNPNHLFNAHPEWFMEDKNQKPMPLNSHYVWINPVLPEVQDHLTQIVTELADVQGLDGVHFDYFRYPGPGFSYDKKSLRLFRKKHSICPEDSTALWNQFRRNAITNWLRTVYRAVKKTNPNFTFSSAIIGDYDNGPNVFLQDSHQWLAEGIIDIVFPMAYTKDTRMLERWLKRHKPFSHGKLICPGLMVYPDSSILQKQVSLIRRLGFSGLSLFAYKNLFPGHTPNRLARFLKNEIFNDGSSQITVPSSTKKVFISDVHWFPQNPTSNDSIRIVCRIGNNHSDSDYQVFGVWTGNGDLTCSRRISFKPLTNKPSYWFTKQKICPQNPGDHHLFRIFAYKPEQAMDTAISSERYQLVIDVPKDSFRSLSTFGPLMKHVTKATVDQFNALWFYEPDTGVRVIHADGTEASFSPITTFLDENRHERKLSNISGLVTFFDNCVGILMNLNGKSYMLSNQNNRLEFEVLYSLPMPALNSAVTENDFLFILQKHGWSVADTTGKIVGQFVFKNVHTPNNIAVSPDGKDVLIACRTEGAVHHWHGFVREDSVVYHRKPDINIFNVGLGGVTFGRDGSIFLTSAPGGLVKVLDNDFHLIDCLQGGKPAIQAPRITIPSPDNQYLYILEIGGTTPVRMKRWEKTSSTLN